MDEILYWLGVFIVVLILFTMLRFLWGRSGRDRGRGGDWDFDFGDSDSSDD